MKAKIFALDYLEEQKAALSATKVHAKVWHKRLGHFNHPSCGEFAEKGIGPRSPLP